MISKLQVIDLPQLAIENKLWYYDHQYQIEQNEPEKISQDLAPFIYPPEHNSDCFPLAINCALRYPWFVNRQQIARLIQKKCHYSYENAKKKINAGIPPTAFRDFLFKDDASYSVQEIKILSKNMHQGPIELGIFLKECLLIKKSHRELIVTGTSQGQKSYTHCFAVISSNDSLLFLESQKQNQMWWPINPFPNSDSLIDPFNLFANYDELIVYQIDKRKVDLKEKAKIERELRYIMLGEVDKEELRKIFIESAKASNEKRRRRKRKFCLSRKKQSRKQRKIYA